MRNERMTKMFTNKIKETNVKTTKKQRIKKPHKSKTYGKKQKMGKFKTVKTPDLLHLPTT